MGDREFDEQADALGVLSEPVRRTVYRYVVQRPAEVSRDEAARGVGISRILAAFHLDRLVAAGLLEASYRRLSGRTGPGAGRTSKLYRRSRREFRLMLPERRYDLMAGLFADALESPPNAPAVSRLGQAAREVGARLGREALKAARPAAKSQRWLNRALRVLVDHGFEPARDGDIITLKNCPFDALAREHRDLVCGANLAMMTGFVDALPAGGARAALEPEPGRCCVRLHLTC